MESSILVSVVGRTDPMRAEHDGPILHIIRHYHPERAVLFLTEEIEALESEYHYNEDAIHLLDKDCQVEMVKTGIKNVHSYDEFPLVFLRICNALKNKYTNRKILLNITSGTPQMETAFCMIALSDPVRYVPLQVLTPEGRSNRSAMFDPRKDLIELWFEMNLDNEAGTPCRCHIPELLNFKRPVVQFQIESLISNYDYAGAYQVYLDNAKDFSPEIGRLLEHAKRRANLEYNEAESIAKNLNRMAELYPVQNSGVRRLMEYYLSILIKQRRGELNDMVLRLEVMTREIAAYILEKCLKISIDKITNTSARSNIMYLSKEKCLRELPHGIEEYLDEEFSDKRQRAFEWGNPINALSMVYIVAFICKEKKYERYQWASAELIKWSTLVGAVRNPAAHTIIAITEDKIKDVYGYDSAVLCRSMQTVLMQAFESQVKKADFEIYDRLNQMIGIALEK